MADLIPDLEQARRFLEILDPGANTRSLLEDRPDGFTFQTFDDSKDRKDRTLARILTGTLDALSDTLVQFNDRGAGIFVTVNETDGRGRKLANLERIRCCWVEDDEGLGIATPVEPHLVTETSPGKYHKLFLVDGLTIEQHAQIQDVLVAEYGSDPNAKDAVRVLRPAGFYHRKGEPFMVRIIHESGKPPYTADDLLEAFKPNPNAPQRVSPAKKKRDSSAITRTQPSDDGYIPLSEADGALPLPDINEDNAAKYLPKAGEQSYSQWRDVGMALHHQFDGSLDGLLIFDEWSQNVRSYKGFEDVSNAWDNFGKRTDGPLVTFRSLVKEYNIRNQKDRSAQANANVTKAEKLLNSCTDYNILVTDIAAKLWQLSHGNVSLEKDFKAALITKYAELRPGHTLTGAEALRAMKSRRAVAAARSVDEIDVNYADAPEWSKNWVWISEEEIFFNVDTRGKLTNSGFRAMFDCRLPVGEGMPTDAARYVRNNNYIPKVMRSMYAPNLNSLFDYQGVSHVNTYSPIGRAVIPEVIQRPDAVATFKKHIELICGGWNREAQLLCNYLTAVTAERPLKVRWAPLIIGEYGDGKSLLSTFIKAAVGAANARTIHGQSIMASSASGQTGWAEGTVFCTIEEVKFHGHNRHDALNLLKTYITNDDVGVKKMYQEIQSIPNTQNYMLYSNYKDAAPIDKGDRRYYILFSKLDLDKMKEDKTDNSYFDRLTDAAKNDAGDIMLWLRTVPVHPDFHPNGHAPMTDDKQTVLRIVKDDMIEEVHEMLEDSKEPLYGSQVVSFTPLFNALMVRSNGALKPNEKHKLTRALLELGFTKLDRCRLPINYDGDNRHALWAKVKEVGESLEKARAIVIERHKRIEHTGLGMEDLL
jgi:hypothetical protein